MEALGDIPAGLWGLLGTIVGGWFVHWGQKRLKLMDDKRETGRDYRAEISELVRRLDGLESEVTFWRRRFYEEQENNALLRITLIQNGIQPPPLVLMPREDGGSDGPLPPPAPPAPA